MAKPTPTPNAASDAATPAPTTLLRLRAAMKFSLWAWAAYWPGFGIILAFQGMDPVSLAVCAFAIAQFVVFLRLGVLRPDPAYSRTLRSYLVERPIYLVFGLLVVLLLSSALSSVTNIGMTVASGFQLAALILLARAAHAHASAQGGYRASKVDQVLLTVLMCVVPALAVFIDSFRPEGVLGTSGQMVIVLNVVNLAFPVLLMLASRALREPLARRNARKSGIPAPAAEVGALEA